MAGDPACWSHLFYDDEGEPKNMTTTAPRDRASGKVAGDLTDFLSKNDDRIMQELFEFLRIPTVRAKSDHNRDTQRAPARGKTPAFAPTVRDGKLRARGSVDDKGHLFLHVKALEAHLATRNKLPLNIVVIAEGEEEVGSEHLGQFVQDQKKLL